MECRMNWEKGAYKLTPMLMPKKANTQYPNNLHNIQIPNEDSLSLKAKDFPMLPPKTREKLNTFHVFIVIELFKIGWMNKMK